MPDFEARLYGAGLSLRTWADLPAPAPYCAPASADAPSRLNDDTAHPATYYRVAPGSTIELRAVVGGVEAPLDAALGGRLFTTWWAQWSDAPPSLSQPGGQSSVVNVTFFNLNHRQLGFFQLAIAREGGGAVFVPLCVEV